MAETTDVIYRGSRCASSGGPAPVYVTSLDGQPLGLLANHGLRHSPTGFAWGYGGSGAAALARSLLIAALGPEARCPGCDGTGKQVHPLDAEIERPYQPGTDALELAFDCMYCDDGWRRLPYQDFKFAAVGRWGDDFQITRTQILNWLAAQPGWSAAEVTS